LLDVLGEQNAPVIAGERKEQEARKLEAARS